MIVLYLSARALSAARSVDPAVSPAAVHAAVEIAVAEELLLSAGRTPAELRARAADLLGRPDHGTGSRAA